MARVAARLRLSVFRDFRGSSYFLKVKTAKDAKSAKGLFFSEPTRTFSSLLVNPTLQGGSQDFLCSLGVLGDLGG